MTFGRDSVVMVDGTGFLPSTLADVWLFSDPVLLGSVDIDENGEFSKPVAIDSSVANRSAKSVREIGPRPRNSPRHR